MIDEETRKFCLLSVMISKYSVYSIPIGNCCGFVLTLSLMMMEVDGSSTGRFTEFSESELSKSTVIGVV